MQSYHWPYFSCVFKDDSNSVLTQVSYPGEARVKTDLLDFVGASQKKVDDAVSDNTVGEALDDVMKSSPHV